MQTDRKEEMNVFFCLRNAIIDLIVKIKKPPIARKIAWRKIPH